MKRTGRLFDEVCSFRNLLDASSKTVKGKRNRPDAARFLFEMENEILDLQRRLTDGTYHPEPYQCFYAYEPKQRYISKADLRDRVVHHAIMNVLEPIFEKCFIYDSYACRREKGTHRAVRRVQDFSRKCDYFLKTDIQKCFESIDHAILKKLLKRKIKTKKWDRQIILVTK